MPTTIEERRAGYSRLARIVTAVSATLATAILFGFLSSVQDLVKQGPVLAAHMAATNQKLSAIENEQASAKMAIASLLKDYTSREQLQGELEKLNEKIRALQVQQAVIEMILKSGKTGTIRQGGNYGQS
jgi:predicted Zn-dependent peptidase